MTGRLVTTPQVGGWRIVEEIDAYEDDHDWAPVHVRVDGLSDTLHPTEPEARAAIDRYVKGA